MKSLEEWANQYGWKNLGTRILQVKPSEFVHSINVLQNYGSITLDRTTKQELTYWNTGNCASQDDKMLYKCIMLSLSLTGKLKINTHSNKYHIRNPRYNRKKNKQDT